jgi:hypothetical protein
MQNEIKINKFPVLKCFIDNSFFDFISFIRRNLFVYLYFEIGDSSTFKWRFYMDKNLAIIIIPSILFI